METNSSTGYVQNLELVPPSLEDNTADNDRLVQGVKNRILALMENHPGKKHFDKSIDVRIPFSLAKDIPLVLRKNQFRVRVLLAKQRDCVQILHISPLNEGRTYLGAAVDLGTTRVVLALVDMNTGEKLCETAFDNPQIPLGQDVLMRIHHAEKPGGLDELNTLITESLNQHVKLLARQAGYGQNDIYFMAVSGNTAMGHLFLGLPPRHLIREPYIPVVNTLDILPASSIGLCLHPDAGVFVFPNNGSYFGGDLISGIMYAQMDRAEETAILVDVGTNAEVVLGNRDWLMACAGAAGPALEGGVTRMGMTAGPGVIDRVRIHPETREIEIHTIEEKPPKGICGSGLIDLAAQMFLAGMIDIRGRFVQDTCRDRLVEIDEIPHFVVVPEKESATGEALTLSRPDLDSLIRSKAAMYTILSTITRMVGVGFGELSGFYIAGTFGSFIDPVSAITIGMIPDLPLSTYLPLGNSSLGGAILLLQDLFATDRAFAIRNKITYTEFNVNQEFMNRFSAAKFIPHTDPERFPSVTQHKL